MKTMSDFAGGSLLARFYPPPSGRTISTSSIPNCPKNLARLNKKRASTVGGWIGYYAIGQNEPDRIAKRIPGADGSE